MEGKSNRSSGRIESWASREGHTGRECRENMRGRYSDGHLDM